MTREIAEQVWPGGIDSIAPLGGGITNRNFLVRVGADSYVLRVGGNDTELLGIDRRVERDATANAAALGLAPEVIAFLEPEGYLVTRFVEGSVGEIAPAEAGALLRRLHGGPPIPGRFDALRAAESYAATAAERGIAPPAEYAEARELGARIERRRGPVALRPCHNDLLAANFIKGPDRTWIVDWEYAGMGDPAFDLANFAVNNGLDADGDRALLDAYGGADPGAHVLMRYLSDLREAMWGVIQQAISTLEFDFAGYAAEHFDRLGRAAAEPRFRRALG